MAFTGASTTFSSFAEVRLMIQTVVRAQPLGTLGGRKCKGLDTAGTVDC